MPPHTRVGIAVQVRADCDLLQREHLAAHADAGHHHKHTEPITVLCDGQQELVHVEIALDDAPAPRGRAMAGGIPWTPAARDPSQVPIKV